MSLTHQVAGALRSRITQGELPAGARLPSERALAAQLEVSRVTVVRALTRLRDEGLLVTRHGSGTYVTATDRLLDLVAPAPRRPRPEPGAPALDLRDATTAGPLDLLRFATSAMRDRLPAALRGDGTATEDIGALTGLLAGHLSLPTRPDQLMLTTGATAGLDIVLEALPPASRRVITETPTYPRALRVLARRRQKALGWPAGSAGWDPEALVRLMRSGPPGLLYLQPDGHNPTGRTMPAGTRESVVRAAMTSGWTVVVEETMRALHLSGEQPPPLAAYDNRVITISSLSKTVWGGLHLGWIRAPASVVRRLRASATAAPSALDQAVATELLASPEEFGRLVDRRRRLLAENARHLQERLEALREAGLAWESPMGGVTLWLHLGRHSSLDTANACARLGVLLEPASTYTVNGRDDSHLRIPFTFPPAILDRVADTLGQVLTGTGNSGQYRRSKGAG